MARIFVSGLLNVEASARVRCFPIDYHPIDYPFFGVSMGASGVALNIAKALATLGDDVRVSSLLGDDLSARLILDELKRCSIQTTFISSGLQETPQSVILYDDAGKRQIYCDLKDIQEAEYAFTPDMIRDSSLVVACNINFNRPLLVLAREQGMRVATDVHVLSDPDDGYNRAFMEAADILFLSDEGIEDDHQGFLMALEERYRNRIIVLGRGSRGAMMYLRDEGAFVERPACPADEVASTAGAGDALFSAFIHFEQKGLHPVEALDLAQLFAATKIKSAGGANGFVAEDELLAAAHPRLSVRDDAREDPL